MMHPSEPTETAMPTKAKNLISVCFVSIILAMHIAIVFPGIAQAKRFPSDVPRDVQVKILQLEEAVGLDPVTGIISKQYSKKTAFDLLAGLQHESPLVQRHCLTLLGELVRQTAAPHDLLNNQMRPSIERFIETHGKRSGDVAEDLVREAGKTLWQIRIKGFADPKERLDFLRRSLAPSPGQDEYYSLEATRYLVDIGGPDAREILEKELTALKRRGQDEPAIGRFSEGLERLDLRQFLAGKDSAERMRQLRKKMGEYKTMKGFPARKFMVWVVREMEKTRGAASTEALREILRDESYDVTLRYEAQECLIRLGELKPKDRKVQFQ